MFLSFGFSACGGLLATIVSKTGFCVGRHNRVNKHIANV